MYKNLLPIAMIALWLISCNPNRVYNTHDKNFPKHRWHKDKVITFKPTIEETNITYDVSLSLRHVFGFQFEKFTAQVFCTSPSGVVTSKEYTFPVMGGENIYLSDCDGDYCDLVHPIEKDFTFTEKGTYTYEVKHKLNVPEVPNVLEFGLIIDKKVSENI